jgi:hypothetical protein
MTGLPYTDQPQLMAPLTSEELLDLGECAVRGYLDFEAAREWFAHTMARRAGHSEPLAGPQQETP